MTNSNETTIAEENFIEPESVAIETEIEEPVETNNVNEETPISPTEVTPPVQEDIDWQDRYIRLAAEFDNFKKRTNKEKDNLVRFGNELLLKAILPIMDDLERALKVAETSENIDALKQGILLVHKNFQKTLENQNIQVVETVGKPFDSEKHEAIASIPSSEEIPKGNIIEEVEKGYVFHEKVIRYSKVIIAE